MFIIFLLITFYFVVDAEALRSSLKDYQGQVQEGMGHYMNTLNNISLMTKYNQLSESTKHEMNELKQRVMQNYQEFSKTFHDTSNKYQELF